MDILAFLAAFFPDAEQSVFLRTFKPKGSPPNFAFPKTFAVKRSDLSSYNLRQELVRVNETAGIYFVVNGGGNTDDEITAFSALFIENDEMSIEDQHKRLDDAPLSPSIRVITKKSVHAYWLLKSPLFRDLQVFQPLEQSCSLQVGLKSANGDKPRWGRDGPWVGWHGWKLITENNGAK